VDIPLCDTVWVDGRYVPLEQATVPITTHAIHYGTSVFEGIRAYWNGENLNIFRLDDHVRRFRRSGQYYNIRLNHTDEDVRGAIVGICRENDLHESCYVRPFYFVGRHGINLHVTGNAPTNMAVFAFPFGDLFDKSGISAIISSWRKFSDASTPTQAKMGGNYLNSIVATGEAKAAGADEAILLDMSGNVSEAPGENIFVVAGDGTVLTPPLSSSALDGITRDAVITIARSLGFDVAEREISPSGLLEAQEVFLTGTAAEIVPVTRVDARPISDGKPGPVTLGIMKGYDEIVMGRDPEHADWLTPVYPK